MTILDDMRFRVGRELQLARGTVLLAFLPALVIVPRAGLGALPQFGVATDGWLPGAVQGITIAAAVWAGLVTLWQARNAWRRARVERQPRCGFVAIQSRNFLRWKTSSSNWESRWRRSLRWCGSPCLAASPSGSSSSLTALPPVFFVAASGFISTLSGLGAVGALKGAGAQPLFGSSSAGAQLDDRIVRLQQIRDWLKDDKLKAMIDDVIGQQVAKSERRQVAYSVTVGALSLLAGWLLSTISPVSALAQLLPR